MPSKNTTKTFILKARAKHSNKYNYKKVHYKNNSIKVKIGCKVKGHGYFEQTPRNHLSGQACPKCARLSTNNKQKMTKDEFIVKAKNVHGDKYIYDKVEYVNNHSKICITCPTHGDFLQTPNLHIVKKNGCKKCGIEARSENRRMTTEEFVARAQKINGSVYDYSKVEYVNSQTKVKIKCKIHGSWMTKAELHLRGSKCPKCAINNRPSNKAKTQKQFLKEMKDKYGDMYDFSKVKYVNDRTKVIVICPKHSIFKKTPNALLRGGCGKCAKRAKYNTALFIKNANRIHNNQYDYSMVKYVDGHTKVSIICPNHEIFEQTPSSHINQKIGCPKCAYKQLSIKKAMTKEEFIAKAIKIHANDKYDYSKVEYVNSKTPITITCNRHNDYVQVPDYHLCGNGCPKCGKIKAGDKLRMSIDEFIQRANEIHHKYDYSNVKYVNSETKIEIICEDHGSFFIRPSVHLHHKQGCPRCSRKNYSRKAVNWINYMSCKENIFIQHAECKDEFRIPGTKYKADGYCAANNTVYEFHGCYYHGCPLCYDAEDLNETTDCFFGDLFQKTINRESIIKSKGYNLVIMWEHDWTAMQTDPDMMAYNEKLTSIQNQAITIVNWYDPHNKIILNKIMGSSINLLRSFLKTAVSNMIQGKQFTI